MLQRARNSALDRHNDITIFSNAPAECDKQATIEFFNLLRSEALEKARIRAEIARKEAETTTSSSVNGSRAVAEEAHRADRAPSPTDNE